MDVDVVHVKDYGKVNKRLGSNTVYIYCGRPSRLSNPYYMKYESERNSVIEKYESDPKCLEVVKEFKLWLLERQWITNIKLGCYCHPKPCHCDVIKKLLLTSD